MVNVIGIDPAPSKKNTVFDGKEFWNCKYDELQSYLQCLIYEKEKILICWDAPLSFSLKNNDTPFSKRTIEKFFSRKEGYKTPDGISVMGYSTCPHWIISQYLLGLPKVNPMETNYKHSFDLVFDKDNILKSITEVHPAVAIWLWTKDEPEINNWRYKKESEAFEKLVEKLINKEIIPENLKNKIVNDDKLDAFIAWKLGVDWLENNNKVDILGNNETGSFLLPFDKYVFEKFKEFT